MNRLLLFILLIVSPIILHASTQDFENHIDSASVRALAFYIKAAHTQLNEAVLQNLPFNNEFFKNTIIKVTKEIDKVGNRLHTLSCLIEGVGFPTDNLAAQIQSEVKQIFQAKRSLFCLKSLMINEFEFVGNFMSDEEILNIVSMLKDIQTSILHEPASSSPEPNPRIGSSIIEIRAIVKDISVFVFKIHTVVQCLSTATQKIKYGSEVLNEVQANIGKTRVAIKKYINSIQLSDNEPSSHSILITEMISLENLIQNVVDYISTDFESIDDFPKLIETIGTKIVKIGNIVGKLFFSICVEIHYVGNKIIEGAQNITNELTQIQENNTIPQQANQSHIESKEFFSIIHQIADATKFLNTVGEKVLSTSFDSSHL